jgi:hypothetical protein
MSLRSPLVMLFIPQTKGRMIFIKGSSIKLAGKAIRSGCKAAIVFGVISAKIKITRVRASVAIAIPASPNKRIAMTVAIADQVIADQDETNQSIWTLEQFARSQGASMLFVAQVFEPKSVERHHSRL